MTTFEAPHVHTPDHSCCPVPATRQRDLAWFFPSPVRVIGLATVGVLIIDAGGTDDGPGLCVFRRCTGGYCPGCGLTRSARHLTRGQIGAAWQDHPWLVLLAAQAVVLGAIWGVLKRSARRFEAQRLLPILGSVNVALVFGIWIYRLIDGSIPRFF